MTIDLVQAAKEKGIKYFLISFTDLIGTQRAKLVPAEAIGQMVKSGAGFAGFATWLDMTPADPDMFAIPDPDSLVQLPWKPQVGWLAASCGSHPGKDCPEMPLSQVLRHGDANVISRLKSKAEIQHRRDGRDFAHQRPVLRCGLEVHQSRAEPARVGARVAVGLRPGRSRPG